MRGNFRESKASRLTDDAVVLSFFGLSVVETAESRTPLLLVDTGGAAVVEKATVADRSDSNRVKSNRPDLILQLPCLLIIVFENSVL